MTIFATFTDKITDRWQCLMWITLLIFSFHKAGTFLINYLLLQTLRPKVDDLSLWGKKCKLGQGFQIIDYFLLDCSFLYESEKICFFLGWFWCFCEKLKLLQAASSSTKLFFAKKQYLFGHVLLRLLEKKINNWSTRNQNIYRRPTLSNPLLLWLILN